MKGNPTIWEKAFAIALLLFSSHAMDILFFSRPVQFTGDGVVLSMQLAFYAVAGIIFLLHAADVRQGIVRVPWLVVLVLFALCSTVWSQDPGLTLRRSAVLAATLLYGIYFGSRFDLKSQIGVLAQISLIVLLLSAVVAIGLPQYGLDADNGGHWSGLFGQRNPLARMSVLSFFVFLVWRPSWRPLRYLAVCIALAVLGMTHSATGVVVIVAILGLQQLFRIIRLAPTARVAVACFAIIIVGAIALSLAKDSSWWFGILGRDSTLSGRTDLWREVAAAIGKRPMLGYGFAAFWPVPLGAVGPILDQFDWASHSHNGLLDLWLDLGLGGVLIFLIGYACTVRDAIVTYRSIAGIEGLWPLTYLAFMFLYNITESTTFVPNSAFLILYGAAAVSTRYIRSSCEMPNDHPVSGTHAYPAPGNYCPLA